MGTRRVVAGMVVLLVCTVAWAGTFSPPGKTTATGQPAGGAGADEPIDTTPPGTATQPPAAAGEKPAETDTPTTAPAEPEAQRESKPKPKPKPVMTPAQARRLYDLRYADQRKKADATSGKADDVALAADHVQVAQKYTDRPRFFQLLCEQAYELAIRDGAGCATAVEAIDLLMEHFPDRKAAYRDKAIRAYELQYRTGRDRQATGERLIELHLAEALAAAGREDFAGAMASAAKAYGIAGLNQSPRKAEVLAKRKYYLARKNLEVRPDDAKLRLSTIRLCIVDLDDPVMAEALLTDDIDEATRTYVPLAAKAPAEVAEGACVELGYWYLELSKSASQAGKATCLTRATTYLQRFLALHEAEDESRIQAQLLLDKAKEQLAPLLAAAEAKAEREPKAKPKPPAEPASTPKTTTRSAPISISARQPWPFSMKVKKGQMLHITATGKWRILPRGKQHGPSDAKYYLRGRLGNGAPFKVGSRYTLKVKEDATLYLGMKEGGIYSNNSGSITVVITKTE